MKVTKKTRLLAKPGPVIHKVVSNGHEEDADALYENAGLVIEGERLGDIESVEMHFRTVDGEALSFDVDGWMSSKTDDAIAVDAADLFRKFRTWCKDKSSALDSEAGATVKLIASSGTVAASRDVSLIEAEDEDVTVTGVRDKNVYNGPAEITVGANEVSVGGTGFLEYPPGSERSLLYLNGELLVDPVAMGSGMQGVDLTLKDKRLDGQPGDEVKVVLMWNGRAYIAHGTLKSA